METTILLRAYGPLLVGKYGSIQEVHFSPLTCILVYLFALPIAHLVCYVHHQTIMTSACQWPRKYWFRCFMAVFVHVPMVIIFAKVLHYLSTFNIPGRWPALDLCTIALKAAAFSVIVHASYNVSPIFGTNNVWQRITIAQERSFPSTMDLLANIPLYLIVRETKRVVRAVNRWAR